ncbi:MAG: acyl transferase domain-containing protein/enoyl-CoA hydratase/carnithine racemase, partial [Phenylobacterium sp.]
KPNAQFLTTSLLDIECPLAGQDIEPGSYDFVIATNVLHATSDMRNTLRNAKACLKPGGLIFINELCQPSLYAHLTFGLLQGWWQHQDSALRIDDSPLLSPTSWTHILESEGFAGITWPTHQCQSLGQQIMIARSDGLVRQAVSNNRQTAMLKQDTISTSATITADREVAQSILPYTTLLIKNIAAKILRIPKDSILLDEPLERYGFDSILVRQLTAALSNSFDKINTALIYQVQTFGELVDHLIEHQSAQLQRLMTNDITTKTGDHQYPQQITSSETTPSQLGREKRQTRQLSDNKIAIIGMSGRYPMAQDLAQFWQVLVTGKDSISLIPQDRWQWQTSYEADPQRAIEQGKSYCKWGGFIQGAKEFDAHFFGISPREVIGMDPQERLFVQFAWQAMEDAGHTRDMLKNQYKQRVGVFAGITRTGFELFGPHLWSQGKVAQPRTSFSSVANRLSYFLDLRGPSMPIDTMCSSSLSAVHQACQHILNGACDLAFAGGVNLYLHPASYNHLSGLQMLSPEGRCKSFGENANGFVPGEGVGIVLLKPLSQAITDGDNIHATIVGSQMNHGGKTNGYTVPNPNAQAALIADALSMSGITPQQLSYIEAHGTGTELGDPIEIAALSSAFSPWDSNTSRCALGSVKTNIGHLEAAAGIAGLTKVILQLKHQTLVPTLHADKENPNIQFADSPFKLQKQLESWQVAGNSDKQDDKNKRRLAGVSSFGAGGTNAHVIVEEYQRCHQVEPPNGAVLVLLSARNPSGLIAYAKKLGDFLSINTLHMKNLAYTTQLGREAFKCRVAMIANNQSDLQQKLASFIANQEDDNIQSGRVNKASLDAINHGEQNPGIERWLEAADYRSLSNAWVQGENVDWQQLYCSAKQTPYRISLPTYPFDNKYFWLELPDADNLQPPPNNDVRLPTAGKINLASPDELAALMHTHTSADIKVKPRFSLSSLTASMALHKPREDNVNTCDTIELPEALVTLNIAFEEDIGDYQLKLDQQMAHITNNDIKVAMLAYNPLSGGSRQHQSILIDFMAALPLPVVSTFCRKPDSLAWCIAGLSDFPLFSQFSNDDLADLTPSQLTVLNARFSGGAELSLDENKPLSLTTAPGMQVVKANQLVAVAADMVQQLQQSPKIALEALKQTLSLSHNSAIKAAFLAASGSPIPPQAKGYGCALMQQSLKALAGQQAGIKTEQQPTYITTFNNVIQLHRCADGVVQLTLCEKAQKNMFSDDFSAGLRAAFLAIEQCHDDKVVVIVGFDQYFCCGGTKDNLLAIYQHQAKFTDNDIHRVAQQCALPVIAAMQGHAIGGGWSFGLFCDLAVFSLQSTYHAPYMRYGFTPGAGSTLIFPDRLGQQLAREILLMAKEYSGFELKEKGLPMPVLPRNEVLPFALSAAHLLATQSRQQLISEKAARVKPFAPRIDTTHQRELAMHERTFVGQTQVLAHINTFFNQPQHSSHLDSSPELLPSAEKTNPSSRQHTHQVLDVLKTLLAKELMLVLADIDDDDLFVDLGIDSIIAVTWINQVNAHFNVSVGSYQVYNHPSLTAFSVFISSLTEPSNAHQASNAQTNTIDPPPVASTIPTPIAPKVLTQLRGSLAAELFMDPSEIEDDAVFIDMGMDSIHVIVWIKKINALFNCQLSTSHIYKYPTLIDLHQYLETIVANNIPLRTVAKKPATRSPHHLTMSASPPSVQAPEQPLAQSQSSVKPVNTDERPAMAVIGMAGQFPGANNLQQYWDNIASGKDCITEIGAQRWDINEFFDQDKQAQGKSYSKWMGAVAGIAHFDPLFFNISPHEAEYMDPQQRLFLQTSWHCIEDAGYNPADLAGTNCGVFVGCEKGDYSERAQHQGLNAYALLGSSMALLPARIAYYLDLQGPCMAIDTACSASLVAIANACDNLQLQNCDIAIAGGVYVLCGPQLHVMMSKAGMLSPTGRCHTFDQQADGFVPGEGVGAILLKRLSDAQQSRDNIRGVIKAWGVNQDGKSNGITAPCGQSQQRLISDTYRRFKVNPNDIQLLEAHGTGTKLGDPIEVDALCASFTPFNQQQHYCALGSVKSNIGHLATAAGIAGTLKILLALKHQQLPPTIHYQSLNEQINLDNSAFFINVKCLPWQVVPGQKRTAAINSFGFSGTNAHLVIEQYGDQPCPTESEPTNTATTRLASLLDVADANATIYPFVLSAANKARLLEYSRLMAAFVDDNRDNRDFSLADFSYTLCLGRKPMDARLGLTFSHIDELIHKLDAFQNQQPSPGYIYADKNQQQSSSLANTSLSQGRDNHLLSQLDAWVKGATIEWSKQVFSAHPHKRCSIPHYPFSKDIYWLEYPAKSAAPTVKQLSMSQIKWLEKGLNPVDLSERFKDKQQHPVVIVYGLQAEKDALMSLLTSVSQSVGLNQTADISCYHYSTIETMPVEISAMSIFVIGVNVDQIMTVMNQLNRDNFNHKEIQIYGLSTEQMLTQAMINSICRQNLMVVHVDNNEKPLQKYQLLLREWLSHDGHTNTANRVVVRHDKNQRFQSQDLPMSIRVGHGERQTDVPAKKQLCRINKSWRKQTLTARPSEPMDNTLVIVNSDNQSLIAGLLYGEAVTMVLADSTLIQFDNWQCGKHSANRIITAYGPVDKILDLSDLYATGQANDSDKAGKIAFYQQLVRECASLNILYLTQSLHSFNNRTMNLAGAKFAGLATTLSVEHPDVVCRHVDVDLAMLDHPLDFKAMLSNEFPCQRLEPQICYRQNQRYVATLTAAQNHQPTSKYTPTPDGVYVISGGLGGIGLQIADYLVQNGAKKLVLMGFNALPDRSIWHSEQLPAALKEKINHIQALEQKLDHLSLYTGSLENQPGVTAYFDMIRAHVGAIVGVVHSAGKGSDFATPAFIAKNQQQIATVMAPKVAALDVMCNIFADDDLAFFVAFSSLTALIPRFAKGCFDYAMANHYVERLMAFKNQHHHKGYKAISWVDWHECGMATRSSPAILKTMNHQLNQLGLFTHSNNEGKALFEQALQQDSDWVLNCYMDLAKFETAVDNEAQKGDDQRHHQYQTPHSAQSPAKHWIVEHIQGWEVIVKQYGAIAPDEIDKIISFEQIQTLDNSLIHRIYLLLYPNLGKPSGQENGHSTANANQTQRLDIIRTTVCKVLKLANIDDDIDFQDYGLDSISATQLALKLEQSLTTQVKSHWLIDFPTINALADKLPSLPAMTTSSTSQPNMITNTMTSEEI